MPVASDTHFRRSGLAWGREGMGGALVILQIQSVVLSV